MEAGKRNIPAIFNRANRLKIPYFQRSYVWQEEQWERFLDDMRYASRTNTPYFMGSVILKQEETTVEQDNIRTIIDGQQRITTFILFFKSLFQKNNTPEKFTELFTNFNGSIILEHNYLDKPIFERIFHDQDLNIREKKSKIANCYQYFLNNIIPNEIDPNRLLSNILFVGIDLLHNEDEQQIFDTINSLGVRLTTSELLKNYLFNDLDTLESFNNNWRDVFEKDDDIKDYWDQEVTSGRNIRNNIDLFLQSYLFIKIQDPVVNVNSEDKERFFKVDSVFNSYKELIVKYGLDKESIINELKEYAAIYKNVINPKIVKEDVDKNDYIQRINLVMFGLDTATIIPYILFVAKNVTNEDEKNKIFRYLETYLMRRLICNKTTKNYNNFFRSLINNQVASLFELKEKIGEADDGMPSNNEVENGFKQSVLTNRQAKGVLYLIEQTIRSNLNGARLKYYDEYSLEHIMPKKWRNNWNDVNMTEEQAEHRDDLILTLGNLTLITRQLNSSIRDSNWETKINGNNQSYGLREYAQGIEIFSKYLQRNSWAEDDIKERAQELLSFSINNVWKLDFE